MKIRQKNPVLVKLIERLVKKSIEEKRPFWKALAHGLNRPSRKEYKVNLYKIEKHAKANETIVVPGSVLGSGNLKKNVNVVALRFTGQAMEKIKNSGGKCIPIEDFAENKNFQNVRIFGG